MIFASDNWAGVAPQINEALSNQATGMSAAYGSGALDQEIEQRFSEIFEREVAVFFVGTGTIANSLALASVNRPGGITLCHRESHMIEDECGAPEFFTGGGRLVPVDGMEGKISAENLQTELDRFDPDFVHHGQPMAVSITQLTEAGTAYTIDEISRLAAISHKHALPFHMDGARFANAMVHLDATPAQMSWQAGVDVLSFGGTKNGCWCAEALVFFDPEMARQLPFIRKRAGQLFSKHRFISAQFQAYFENGLWLELAQHSNRLADRLREAISSSNVCRLAWQTQANEIFLIMPTKLAERMHEQGAQFYPWRPPHGFEENIAEREDMYRLVTSFANTDKDIDQFIEKLRNET